MIRARALSALDAAASLVAILATVLLLWFLLLGCSVLPPVEVCVDHPTYGQVCLSLEGGKVRLAVEIGSGKALGEAERAELERWYLDRTPE